jgi:tetratricopeptide (TPR) repeat protein
MRLALRIILAGIGCVAIAAGVVAWLTGAERWGRARPIARGPAKASTPARPAAAEDAGRETFPDPNAPGTSARVFVERVEFEADLLPTVLSFTGPIRDPSSLQDLREAIRGRSRRGIAALREQADRLALHSPPTVEQAFEAIRLWRSIAFLDMYEGKFAEAASWLERALELSRTPGVPAQVGGHMRALLGIVALRRGEVENCLECLGPSSCIFPIDRAAVHRQQAGSREAVQHFTAYLDQYPGDLRVRWLLNIAAMTLGEYPEKVPSAYLIRLDRSRSKLDIGRFDNVAARAGLGVRGPNLAGGSLFDDFDGDGRPDLFTTSIDADLGASLFINRGDGTFEDRSASAGLSPQVYALNAARADYDNDGNPDILLLRGAWEQPARLSLLRNKGGGAFEDVTLAAGLGEPIATESAAWGDYDNDGRLDLFVCGEYLPPGGVEDASTFQPDSRNRCRLYHNRGDGTFEEVAEKAGVTNERCGKGSAWGDYDGDGRLDLFVSNMGQPCRLYHNQGDGTFRDVAEAAGVAGPAVGRSFSCWFWDYDNDGRLDLFVNDYNCFLADAVADVLGLKVKEPSHPRLYRNLGAKGFRDVSLEVGLSRPISAMGSNFGDIDNDGYLDAYFGTGWMSYAGLVPNVLLKNVEGRRFEDVTDSTRTGHLQKGHGVSFADYDDDGDLDLFVVLGGGGPGDQGYNALFRNPGHGRHWLKVRLIGTKTNRSALGARVQVELKGPDGSSRSIYRTIGNNGSFGGNSLVEQLGLGDANSVTTLTVTWPTSKTVQTFRDVAADQEIEITEGDDSLRVIRRPPRSSAPR